VKVILQFKKRLLDQIVGEEAHSDYAHQVKRKRIDDPACFSIQKEIVPNVKAEG
jgi:hypothetical protein